MMTKSLSAHSDLNLNDVMTPAEIEREFHLPAGTVRNAIRDGYLAARKADDRTWLVLRADAEKRWQQRKQVR